MNTPRFGQYPAQTAADGGGDDDWGGGVVAVVVVVVVVAAVAASMRASEAMAIMADRIGEGRTGPEVVRAGREL